jgi:Txe/YoeB family toxin of toxin-antitoxin system
MSKLTFAEKAWADYLYWQANDRKTLKRINLLLQDISRNGGDGIGKPEPLKYRDAWSRRRTSPAPAGQHLSKYYANWSAFYILSE